MILHATTVQVIVAAIVSFVGHDHESAGTVAVVTVGHHHSAARAAVPDPHVVVPNLDGHVQDHLDGRHLLAVDHKVDLLVVAAVIIIDRAVCHHTTSDI